MEDQFEEKIATLTRSAGLKVEYRRRIDSQPWGPRRWSFYGGDYRLLSTDSLSDEEALAFIEGVAVRKESAI